jgi:hypothetical protein
MKKLASAKTRTIFETAGNLKAARRWRQIIVAAHPTHAEVWLKGTRQKLVITWEGIFMQAAKCAADNARREKLAAKKGKRK